MEVSGGPIYSDSDKLKQATRLPNELCPSCHQLNESISRFSTHKILEYAQMCHPYW